MTRRILVALLGTLCALSQTHLRAAESVTWIDSSMMQFVREENFLTAQKGLMQVEGLPPVENCSQYLATQHGWTDKIRKALQNNDMYINYRSCEAFSMDSPQATAASFEFNSRINKDLCHRVDLHSFNNSRRYFQKGKALNLHKASQGRARAILHSCGFADANGYFSLTAVLFQRGGPSQPNRLWVWVDDNPIGRYTRSAHWFEWSPKRRMWVKSTAT